MSIKGNAIVSSCLVARITVDTAIETRVLSCRSAQVAVGASSVDVFRVGVADGVAASCHVGEQKSVVTLLVGDAEEVGC